MHGTKHSISLLISRLINSKLKTLKSPHVIKALRIRFKTGASYLHRPWSNIFQPNSLLLRHHSTGLSLKSTFSSPLCYWLKLPLPWLDDINRLDHIFWDLVEESSGGNSAHCQATGSLNAGPRGQCWRWFGHRSGWEVEGLHSDLLVTKPPPPHWGMCIFI